MNFGNKSVLNSGAHRLAFEVGAKTTQNFLIAQDRCFWDGCKVNRTSPRLKQIAMIVKVPNSNGFLCAVIVLYI